MYTRMVLLGQVQAAVRVSRAGQLTGAGQQAGAPQPSMRQVQMPGPQRAPNRPGA
jgi:hypothetical protein